MPATDAALASLLRNHDNLQKQYNAAIAQRAEASTGEQLEIRSDGERFSLLEPAIAPSKADGPKRRMIVLGGAAGGLGLGIALVALLELLNNTVRRPQDITKLLQVEPLATIPVIRTTPARRSWKPAAAAALVIACTLPSFLTAADALGRPGDPQPRAEGVDFGRTLYRLA